MIETEERRQVLTTQRQEGKAPFAQKTSASLLIEKVKVEVGEVVSETRIVMAAEAVSVEVTTEIEAGAGSKGSSSSRYYHLG